MYWVIFMTLWLESGKVRFRFYPTEVEACQRQATALKDEKFRLLALGVEIDLARNVAMFNGQEYKCLEAKQ